MVFFSYPFTAALKIDRKREAAAEFDDWAIGKSDMDELVRDGREAERLSRKVVYLTWACIK